MSELVRHRKEKPGVWRRIAKVFSNLITILLVLLFTVVIVFSVSSRISGGAPQLLGYEIMTVLSGSMEPGIQTGSVIALKPVENAEGFKSGDVITFRSPEDQNIIITHRIQEVQSVNGAVQYITKGDNNDAQDAQPIPSDHIIASYVNFTIPWLGYLFTFIKSTAGVVLLMIVPGALLILWQMANLYRTISRMEDTKEAVPAVETK
ncbi:hypothetical protein SY83_12060 [Paenibacillus swuensis]|uniref:Signal peptidase I n=1 Tax=Paenibacillus swuensis TaxID=1178515 RepID=A0A172TIQ3_9BACL|nr:signal peptidase I [Paenibacillus swuensis]ANE46890.1 hypothetical protein SY83_12060 [Paenibacillus swuensis]